MSGFVFNEKPITIESGEGAYLYADDGTEYLDFGASYAVAALGHSHPAVVSAIQEQAAKLTYVQASYPVDVRTELYEKLATVAPGDLSNVWLCNSGTEANEAAMKFARSATGRQKIIATKRAFHGRTLGALALTWKQKYKKPYEPVAGGVEFVSYGDEEELADAIDDETAAVFLEPIQGEGGINPAAAEYLQAARDLTEDAGAALVFDEIQTGIGRTGSLWACENVGVVPDILTSAKGIANGLPLGATLCADWIADGAASHGSTFSGGPVVCAAANATLDTIVEEDLPGHAAAVGDYFTTELEAAVEEHDLPVRDVRGEGLMVGVEVKRGANRTLKHLALSEQLLALPAGRTVVRFLPPLIIDEEHADRAVDAMTNVLS
ncbi:acetylornithine/succinylornithine family transaminase [Haloferax mediterranei ATCC 33500]|uniref:Putative [LysW]-aminoadipate semialdehyde/glutamate semialdehyde transaminase n=1 Tax=Haloferax mediterranei (strain ATCC 33500 / DSM 1411 / JCM 8866 / NBRC 14739 / NCIMB 2177 / R-4) TaxID=523841 RepID=I3R0M7_HALMT|nr:acetylornithine/succinylornithine family transaminase [Haloferax mediterranei]AFK17787.1 acetylornithine aminotransferase [Haloferax mediterranei ATCC 33500]EMA02942.1 acetylornithine aminotransferase [Haloferax mediterranei ATCC 33500]MDX5987876.1 acetylornithine/succinylornithine family transaminase [Haloferax mediterranei ATCC 33500]QCQ74350.1 acetylornithine/succinylornithine family transaminase [Haloferax mediterranei ATCC 33500]